MGLVLQRKRDHATLSLKTTIFESTFSTTDGPTCGMSWRRAPRARAMLSTGQHDGGKCLLNRACHRRRPGLRIDLSIFATSDAADADTEIAMEMAVRDDGATRIPAHADHVQHALAAHGSAGRRDG